VDRVKAVLFNARRWFPLAANRNSDGEQAADGGFPSRGGTENIGLAALGKAVFGSAVFGTAVFRPKVRSQRGEHDRDANGPT
jgi:hypothetical protein